MFLQQPPLYMQKWSHSPHPLFIDEKLNATGNKHCQNIWGLENLALTSIKLGVKMQLQAACAADCPVLASTRTEWGWQPLGAHLEAQGQGHFNSALPQAPPRL